MSYSFAHNVLQACGPPSASGSAWWRRLPDAAPNRARETLQFDAFPGNDDQVAGAAFGGDPSSPETPFDAYAFRVVQGEQFAGGELGRVDIATLSMMSSMLFTHP